jgi:hypothetical protein
MKHSIAVLLLVSVLLGTTVLGQPQVVNTNTSAPSSPLTAGVTAPSAPTPVAPDFQAPATPSISPLSRTQDGNAITVKDALALTDQTVGKLASMYQSFALFITGIVTVVGLLGTAMAYFARKSVHDFMAEWKDKFLSLQSEITAASTKITTLKEEMESIRVSMQKVFSDAVEEASRVRTSAHQILRRR